MATQPPPPPPATRTTISDLRDDLLREIFLRLPDLPSLVRAAFACRAFRRAVRSSPAFRRIFRALHAPPLLAFFLVPNFEVAPVFPCTWRRRDPDLVAADFFHIRLSRHNDAQATGWEIGSQLASARGYLILNKVSGGTKRTACYNPLTQALYLFLPNKPPGFGPDLRFYNLYSKDGEGPSRVVCVHHHRGTRHGRWAEQVAVFSSDTMEWKIFPKNALPLRQFGSTGTVMRGLIWWGNWMYDQVVVLDTASFQFSLIDVPTTLRIGRQQSTYKLGETKDEKLCIVDIKDNTLVSYVRTTDGASVVVERWVLYKEFPLHPIVKNVTGCSMKEVACRVSVELVAVIDGFVYLSIFYCKDSQDYELCLSLCLETSEMSELFKDAYRYNEEVHPYVMAWPPCLLQSKEESETEFTGDIVAHDRLVSTVLVTALQSFSQALMNDSDSNKEIVAELDAFLGRTEDEDGSLISKLTTLDAQLSTARDRILRIKA